MHSVSFCSAFLFSAQLLNNILGTEYGFSFVSVFEYGCENEGLKITKEFSFIFYGKSFDSETIDDEIIS